MKTKDELNALKEEVVNLNKKLAELTDEELTQISGGILSKMLDLVERVKISSGTVIDILESESVAE